MTRGTEIAAAVGLGYLLGRRRKLGSAIVVGAAVAAGRLSVGQGGLVRQTTDALRGSPEWHKVSKLGGPLLLAGKTAAKTAVRSRLELVGDRLRERRKATGGHGDPEGSVDPGRAERMAEAKGKTRKAVGRIRTGRKPDEDKHDDEAYDDALDRDDRYDDDGYDDEDRYADGVDRYDDDRHEDEYDDNADQYDDGDEDEDDEDPPRRSRRSASRSRPTVRRRGNSSGGAGGKRTANPTGGRSTTTTERSRR